MKVSVFNRSELIWERSEQGGVASSGYLTDGTQEKIIAALLCALRQAKVELGCPPQDLYRMTDVCRPAAEVNDNVPISGTRGGNAGR